MNQPEAATTIILTLGSILTWGLIVYSLLLADGKFLQPRIKNWFGIYLINQACAFLLAIAQFYALSLIADQFTGYGFGYAGAAAAILYLCGSLPVAILATLLFYRRLRRAL